MMGFLSSLWGKLVIAGTLVAAILLAALRILSGAKQSGRDEVNRQNADRAVKNVETRNDVEESNAAGGIDARRERVRRKWTRG